MRMLTWSWRSCSASIPPDISVRLMLFMRECRHSRTSLEMSDLVLKDDERQGAVLMSETY
jgi:hypothetical protein